MIERPPPLEFSYGVIEKALAVAYGISDERRPVGFRGMISNLHKLGALGPQSRVGRGAKLTYTVVEMHRLVLALEFSELGLTPATVVGLLETYWESILWPIIHAAARPLGLIPEEPAGNADIILVLRGGSFRTGSLRGEAVPGVPNIDQCSLDQLPLEMKQWMAMTPPRALAVNISARLRAFHSALADTYMDELVAERRATLAGAPEVKNKGPEKRR